jgi:heme-degrading monooxygenase HmoA
LVLIRQEEAMTSTQDGGAAAGPRGFIAIYRWKVQAEHEQSFRERWHQTTLRGQTLGAFGSCLTRDASGEFVAIALWPDEATRTAAFASMGPQQPWLGAERLQEVKLAVEDDLWTNSPFRER